MSNNSGTLYVGVTNNIKKRVYEHKNKIISGFTAKYNIDRLMYYEQIDGSISAITREKQIKHWRRQKKIDLIKLENPAFKDLSCEWFN